MGCPGASVPCGQCVLAYSQQEEEGDDDQVGESPVLGIERVTLVAHHILEDGDGQCKLGARRWIFSPIAMKEVSEGYAKLGSIGYSTSRVWMVGQNKGLGDMAQGCGHGLTTDLSALTKSASTDSGSESHEYVGLLGLRHVDEELVEGELSASVTPVAPMGGSGFCVHHCIGNLCPRRVEITSKLSSDFSGTSLHERILENKEREKTVLNEVRNCSYNVERSPLAQPWWKHEKERDAVSTEMLCNPAY
jgi:hypothetical protein